LQTEVVLEALEYWLQTLLMLELPQIIQELLVVTILAVEVEAQTIM
jgi:hypothetical protein